MSTRSRRVIGIAVGIVALAFIIIGLVGNEQTAVLRKAVRICLECIGIA